MTMDLVEGVGESSSPPRSLGSSNNYDVRTAVFNRLVESGNVEVAGNPDFKEQLDAHFNRLPSSYILDINLDRVEDVLVHHKLLSLARDPTKRPAYHIRFLENLHTESNPNEDQLLNTSPSQPFKSDNNGAVSLHERALTNEFESWSKLEDLNLDVRENSRVVERECLATADSQRSSEPVHEVIFSTVDKPKTLSQLSALLSDIGLNIREAHVFSTTDGYSLDVFVVDGWNVEDTDGLYKAMEDAISRSEGSWSGCSPLSLDKVSVPHTKSFGWEIDRSLLEVGDKIASGTYGDLYRGLYLCQDVAVKIYRSEDLTNALEDEFAQEVAILREVQHKNVVRFIGACTRCPHLWIVTEYMPRGSLYSYLQRHRKAMKLSQVLKFAIDVSKGMDYLHQMNIVHRDLKTANLLLDINSVVKVADFGVARFQTEEGVMTAETGTYRWMAPEVINHEPYDQKADVFSFGIVLWELLTAKVPYESMTPLQAALGVRQGLRPEIPEDANPKLVELMQRCWDADPARRPSFSEIMPELEVLFSEVTHTRPSNSAL